MRKNKTDIDIKINNNIKKFVAVTMTVLLVTAIFLNSVTMVQIKITGNDTNLKETTTLVQESTTLTETVGEDTTITAIRNCSLFLFFYAICMSSQYKSKTEEVG